MNKAKNTGLVILFIIQAALIVYLYRPGRNAPPPATALFNGLQPDTIISLTITEDTGKTISLTKIKQTWTLGSNGYPGDNDKINNIIKRIANLKSSRLVSRTKGSHSRLKVGDKLFNRRIVLSGPDRKKAITFFLGTAPDAKVIHLRRAGDDDVYDVSGLSFWQLQANSDSWWQTKYVMVNSDDLQSLALTKSGNKITLQRNAKGNWQLAGAPADCKLDGKRVAELLNTVSEISVSGYENKDFKPHGKAMATLTYKTRDKSFNLQIWPTDKKTDEQIVKNSQARFYAKLEPYVLKNTLELKKTQLLLKAPPAKKKDGSKKDGATQIK